MRRAVRQLTIGLMMLPAAFATATGAPALARGVAHARHGHGTHATTTVHKVPGAPAPLAAVACASATTCYGVGTATGGKGEAVVTIHSGVPSRATVFDRVNGANLNGIACSGTSCEATGTTKGSVPIAVAIDGGIPGPIKPVGPAGIELNSVACWTAGSCLVVGDTGLSGFGAVVIPISATIPSTPQLVAREVLLDSIACPTATLCYALAAPDIEHEDLFELGPNGNVLRGPTPFGSFSPLAIACPSTDTCFAVGDYVHHPPFRAGVVTIKNGVPGTARPVPGVNGLSQISCPTVDMCEAVGYHQRAAGARVNNLLVNIHGGLPGAHTTVPYTPGSIACPLATSCVLVGSASSRPYDGIVSTLRLPRFSNGSGGRRF